MKGRLLVDMQEAEKEEDRLKEYRHEMELLNQERLAHVEELRQIHSDINTVSNPLCESTRQTTNDTNIILRVPSNSCSKGLIMLTLKINLSSGNAIAL